MIHSVLLQPVIKVQQILYAGEEGLSELNEEK